MTGSQITVRFCAIGGEKDEGVKDVGEGGSFNVFRCPHLAAAGETPVVVRRPAGAVSVMLVLKEAGVGVLLQLFGVLRHDDLIYVWLLNVNPGPRLAVIGHMDLDAGGGGRGND